MKKSLCGLALIASLHVFTNVACDRTVSILNKFNSLYHKEAIGEVLSFTEQEQLERLARFIPTISKSIEEKKPISEEVLRDSLDITFWDNA